MTSQLTNYCSIPILKGLSVFFVCFFFFPLFYKAMKSERFSNLKTKNIFRNRWTAVKLYVDYRINYILWYFIISQLHKWCYLEKTHFFSLLNVYSCKKKMTTWLSIAALVQWNGRCLYSMRVSRVMQTLHTCWIEGATNVALYFPLIFFFQF